MVQVKKALGKTIGVVAREVQQLREAVEPMERNIAPKGFVVNLDTGSTHKILTTVNERGNKAMSFCGWKYARRDFKVVADLPTRRKATCGTCMPGLRASLPDEEEVRSR